MNELIFSSSSITTCSLAERDTVHADNDILIVHGWRMDAMDGGSMTMILEDAVDEAEVDDSPLGSRPVFVAGLVPHHPCPRHPAFPGHVLVPAGAPVQEQPQAALGLRRHLLIPSGGNVVQHLCQHQMRLTHEGVLGDALPQQRIHTILVLLVLLVVAADGFPVEVP
jgi:hypothetical protein